MLEAIQSVEVLLNLCWLLLVFGALFGWFYGALAQRNPGLFAGLLSLVCVLAVLFPIISATDDLVWQEFVYDANAPQVSLVKSFKSSKTSVPPVLATGLLPPAVLSPASLIFPGSPAERLSCNDGAGHSSVWVCATGNHSPPLHS